MLQAGLVSSMEKSLSSALKKKSKAKGHPMSHWKRLLADENGATAVEYALLLGTIIVVSVTTLGGFGTGVNNVYNVIDGALPTR